MTLRDFDAILNDPALIKAAKRRYARQGQEAAARLGNTEALAIDILQTLVALRCLFACAPTPRARR